MASPFLRTEPRPWEHGSTNELAGCTFVDARLAKRFGRLMEQLATGVGQTLPLACGDWASTKAAYRFLDNDRVSEAEILAGHYESTRTRFAAVGEPVLVLHDTTDSFIREKAETIGLTRKHPTRQKDACGRCQMRTACGILMHSSLVVTTDGLPLGLAAIKLWTRRRFKGTSALQGRGIDGEKHTVNLARIPIEEKESVRWVENVREATATLGDPVRCVHVGDRESDIYELFCECESLGSKFVFRTCVNRRAEDGERTVVKVMDEQRVKAVHRLEVRDEKGNPSTAVLELKYQRMQVCPPIGKEKRYSNLQLTVIHATGGAA